MPKNFIKRETVTITVMCSWLPPYHKQSMSLDPSNQSGSQLEPRTYYFSHCFVFNYFLHLLSFMHNYNIVW